MHTVVARLELQGKKERRIRLGREFRGLAELQGQQRERSIALVSAAARLRHAEGDQNRKPTLARCTRSCPKCASNNRTHALARLILRSVRVGQADSRELTRQGGGAAKAARFKGREVNAADDLRGRVEENQHCS